MAQERLDSVAKSQSEEAIELYGDPQIATGNAKVPRFLKFSYIFWPIWGLVSLYYFWNGSTGWLDHGYWRELQIAANTTFPTESQSEVSQREALPKKE